MAVFNPPHLVEVSLQRFVEDNKDNLPAVVEVAEGIYGEQEKDSEVRDFSNGDILRLLSIKEEVNITFDAVYSAPSKKGLITVNKSFSGAQFKVISPYKDGHVYESIHALILDFPDYIQAIKPLKVDGVLIKKGDRLKLLSKGMDNVRCMTCRIIRTSETVNIYGDLKESFAKKVDKSHEVLNLADIYHRLPQRVLLVRDVGQTLRGIPHGIEGLDPQFDCPMNLSKIEIVEACLWENPDNLIRIPLTTSVSVYPRKDWGEKVGPLRDIHDLAKEATAEAPKAAVVVDPDSVVPGCTKDTIVVVYGTSTLEYGLCKGKDQTFLLIPANFPSKFKVCVNTWSTVEDLLCSGVKHEVRVGTTFRQQQDGLDTLHENDVVQILDSTTEVFYGATEDLEVIKMQRNRSSSGRVGTIHVPTFARGNFYENPNVVADVPLSQLLAQASTAKVTLSRPCVSPDQHDLDFSDDLLIRISPLEILGKYQISVTHVTTLTTNQQQLNCGLGCSIAIPETKKLAVRSISRSIKDITKDVGNPKVINTIIVRASMKDMQQLQKPTISTDSVYSAVPPPIPNRISKNKPPRPLAAKPLDLVQNIEGGKHETAPKLPPKGPSSPILPGTQRPQLSPNGRQGAQPSSSATQNRSTPKSLVKRIPTFFNKVLEKKVEVTRHVPHAKRETENPYNLIEEENFGSGRRGGSGYEDRLPPEGGSDSDDDDDYEKPQDIFQPPADGNVASFEMREMVQLLKYLDVDRNVVSNFITRGIDGKKLCTLKRQVTDDNLRDLLGVDSLKDWYSIKYFIDKSS